MHFACFLAPGFHMPVALTGMLHSLLLVDCLKIGWAGIACLPGTRSSKSLTLNGLGFAEVLSMRFLTLSE